MQELHRHSEVPFELVFLGMDPGYNAINRQRIESNAALLHIPITVFETNIFEVANSSEKSPCYLCAQMRRGYLYSKAKELGCNKIALGHHFNDVIETTVMGSYTARSCKPCCPCSTAPTSRAWSSFARCIVSTNRISPPGVSTTSGSSSSAPAALREIVPSATTAEAAQNVRRSKRCCAV